VLKIKVMAYRVGGKESTIPQIPLPLPIFAYRVGGKESTIPQIPLPLPIFDCRRLTFNMG